MADQPAHPNTTDETRPVRGSTKGMPRWVKVSLIIVGLLVVLFGGLKLLGVGGQHGPGRHMPSGLGGESSPSLVTQAYAH